MWYEILGIPEDADKKTIKRAYAKLLKSIDQESEMERFMAVNKAYKEGLERLEYSQDQIFEEEDLQPIIEESIQEERPDISLPFHDLYMDKEKRDDVKEWEKLIKSLNLDDSEQMEDLAPEFFNDRFILSPSVFKCINNHYHLTSDSTFNWSFIIESPQYFEEGLTSKEMELRYLIHYYFLNSNFPKVIEHVDLYLEEFETFTLIYKYLMISHYSMGNLDECRKNIDRLEELDLEIGQRTYYRSLCLYHEKDYKASRKLIEDFDTLKFHNYRSIQSERALLNMASIYTPENWVQKRPAETSFLHFELKGAPFTRKLFLKRGLKGTLGIYESIKTFIRWILYIIYIIMILVVGLLSFPFRFIWGKITGNDIMEVADES